MTTYPIKYIPKSFSKTQKRSAIRELERSKRAYKRRVYYTRKPIKGYLSKPSKHILKARQIYNIQNIFPSKTLSKKTGCSLRALNQIVKKGQGAYYSSGSRPSQTAHSWGHARLASAITGGKSAAVDFHIIDKGCNHTKKAFKLALKAKRKHKRGTRRVPKIGGLSSL